MTTTKAEPHATKQAPRAGNGGTIPPVERRSGQPNGNPRHNGAWKKEDTLRYKLQQIAKMNREELVALANDETKGEFERATARTILDLQNADLDKRWRVVEGLTNQDSGFPKQQVEQTNVEIKPFLPKPKKKK